MHEFGVAAAVLDAVEARAAGRPVRAVRLHVGALQRLDRDVFDQAFALIADGGVADGAAIDIVEVRVAVRCRGCHGETTGTVLITRCARCGEHDLDLISGDDLVLESITIADPEAAAPDRIPHEQEVG